MKFTILAISIAAASIALSSNATAALKDGTYTAEVVGHNAPMTVQVTIGSHRQCRNGQKP